VESLLGRASAVLYQFQISGTVADQVLVPVPVPVLSTATERAILHLATRGFDGDVLAP
jgi:hypothetical protein